MRLADFNSIIIEAGEHSLSGVAEKYLLHGTPAVFEKREEDFYDFKNRIAKQFSIGTHEVFIVGSAKQGFSYYKQRDNFTYESDVDVAIISHELYEQYSIYIREYEYKRKAGLVALTGRDESRYKRFLRNFALGWIRPDIFPEILNDHTETPSWSDFFKSISSDRSEVGDYEVRAGIFKSYEYLKEYHMYGLKSKLKELEMSI